MIESLKNRISALSSSMSDSLVMDVFHYQFSNNPVYQKFCKNLGKTPESLLSLDEIPYIPVSAFKNHIIKSGEWQEELIFSSSATTGQIPSQHYVKDAHWYDSISSKCFNQFYGNVGDYGIYALLPSYLERSGSSLIYMADHFLSQSGRGGFYLYNHEKLVEDINRDDAPKILLGVSFALLDLAGGFAGRLDNTIVMETGGMKGRKKEIPRNELHKALEMAFIQPSIHSEYGMTEMMSQAYSRGKGIFYPPDTMKVSTVQITDPLSREEYGKSGLIRILDLGNIDTCCFLQTDDLGVCYKDGSFEILGRVDHSEIRGCNLMVSEIS